MLHEEVKKYRELSGDTNPNTPISRIGGYLDGYEKALEQEPCEDCISRREAIKMFTYNYKGKRIPDYDCDNWPVQIDIKTVKEMLRELPPVNPQPKMGQWIKYGTPRCGEQHYQCTSCGYYINFGQWGELYTKEFKYCPNCGAKMIEPQESEVEE